MVALVSAPSRGGMVHKASCEATVRDAIARAISVMHNEIARPALSDVDQVLADLEASAAWDSPASMGAGVAIDGPRGVWSLLVAPIGPAGVYQRIPRTGARVTITRHQPPPGEAWAWDVPSVSKL